jgi:hypothetical protein
MIGRAGIWLALLVAAACAAPAVAVDVNPPLPTGKLVIAGRVTLTVELARSPGEQVRGLSGRPSLAPGNGMLFVYDRQQPVASG